MTTKIGKDFKIICKFPEPTKENLKALEEAKEKLTKMFAYEALQKFYGFLEQHKIKLEDLASGKITIEDIKRKLACNYVHDNLSKIILLIKDNPKITLSELATAIGKCKKTVQRIIASSNKILRVRSAKNGYWIIQE